MSGKEISDSNDNDVSEQEESDTNADVKKSGNNKINKVLTKKTKNEYVDIGESSESSEKVTQKGKLAKSRKKTNFEIISDSESEKVPLLDQPTVIEGSRNRKTIIQYGIKNEGTKNKFSIEIPNGKGTQLGRIPIINARIKRLRLDEIKHLHRLMFGRLGKANFANNIQKFRGFTFEVDSDEYIKKLAILNKWNMSILKEILLILDLDMKIKKKEDVSKAILDFLVSPKPAEKSVNPPLVSHPKRRATKRNYFERDVEEEDIKKRKKGKAVKSIKETENVGEENETVSDAKVKSAKTKDKEVKNSNNEQNDGGSGNDNNSELKKPAKKRKRNQVIEDQEETPEETKTKKRGKSSDDTKSKEHKKNVLDRKSESETDDNVEEKQLSDEDLKNFLKKVLADANLEKTTMKTVYGLINTHYPNYNCSEKKDFIKGVVKSLIQT